MTDKNQGAPPSETDFGYRTIPREAKKPMVRAVFDSVASRYDVMNDLMSLGIHRAWKRDFVAGLDPRPNRTLLDLAGGTGDITFAWLARGGGPATLTDINEQMLAVAARRATDQAARRATDQSARRSADQSARRATDQSARRTTNQSARRAADQSAHRATDQSARRATDQPAHRATDQSARPATARSATPAANAQLQDVTLLVADAESLPFPDSTYDRVTIAFGLRNCTDKRAVLQEARRVLRPGGQFHCLEFSKLQVAALEKPYDTWSFQVLPRLGQLVAGDAESYRYLAESIRTFPDQDTLAAMMREAGLARIQHRNLTGGIAAIHTGRRL